jgi:hypothetical protein
MDPRERLARLAQLKAEGDAIMQELIAAGMRPEQIMAAVEGGGQPPVPMGGPGMGGPAMGAVEGGPGMGVPQGLLGPM